MARFPCATWRPINANTGGMLGPNLGLVLHHAVANGSLWSFFNSPSAQVSAHFWVAQSGTVEQYVDTDVVAWHGRSLNSRYVGVETEGCSQSPHADPMSDAMVAGLAAIFAEGMARHGWPPVHADADGQPGFGYHRMAVNTACPCDVRLNRRDDILALATGAAPAPEQTGGAVEICSTPSGAGYWIVGADGGVFTYGDAGFYGSLGDTALAAPIVGMAATPSGCGYWLLGADGGVFTFGDAEFLGAPTGLVQ
jgi:N-acetylmuramoyl-L-alanine amidase